MDVSKPGRMDEIRKWQENAAALVTAWRNRVELATMLGVIELLEEEGGTLRCKLGTLKPNDCIGLTAMQAALMLHRRTLARVEQKMGVYKRRVMRQSLKGIPEDRREEVMNITRLVQLGVWNLETGEINEAALPHVGAGIGPDNVEIWDVAITPWNSNGNSQAACCNKDEM